MSVRAHERLEYEPAGGLDGARTAPIPADRSRHRRAVHLRFVAWVVALVAAISFVGGALAGPRAGSGHDRHLQHGGTRPATQTESGGN